MRYLFLLYSFYAFSVFSQTPVTEIYTDYKGFWKSSQTSIVPDSSHNLLAFDVGGTIYSTGVDDAVLQANGLTFSPQDFTALPTASGIVFQYIGVGYEYKGSGNISPTPVVNDGSVYLTDGKKGLDIGTAIFNSTGSISYSASSLDELSIDDGVPDIIITQVGDPDKTKLDKFKFIDANGAIVGNELSINFSATNVPIVGKNKWKFYDKNLDYASISGTNRDIRVITFDLHDFGITSANIQDITSFVHVLSTTSDQAFVAYNQQTLSVLPVELTSFTAFCEQDEIVLNWTSETESNVSHYEIFESIDGENWRFVHHEPAVGNSSKAVHYHSRHQKTAKTSYLQLVAVDLDGSTKKHAPVSAVCEGNINTPPTLFPNPASDIVSYVINLDEKVIADLLVYNLHGAIVFQKEVELLKGENNVYIPVNQLANGIYSVQLKLPFEAVMPLRFVKE